jgi:nitrous oxidase accessory protein NosD
MCGSSYSTQPSATGHSRPNSTAFSLALALVATLPLGAWASEIVVPSGSITTVQAAVDVAQPGDTIKVLPGSYEAVSISTSGLKLMAETEAGTVTVNGFTVMAEDVEIKGFDVSDGIVLIDAPRGQVSNNSVSAGVGIFVLDSEGVKINHNTVVAETGILVSSCSPVQVDHNTVDALFVGIAIDDCSGAKVDHNRAIGNDAGIAFSALSASRIEYNHAEGFHGIDVRVRDGGCGNAFAYNNAVGSEFGLYSDEAPEATCNSYQKNKAATAFPSLKFWGAK